MKLNNNTNIPLFMSCSTFEQPDSEFILYMGQPRMLFEVVEETPQTDVYAHIRHEDGEEDYIMVAECLDVHFFDGKTDNQITEHIGEIMSELEDWYIAEVLDLNNYEEE